MSSRSIVARNLVILLVSQVTTNLLSFVTVPLVARTLGSGEYGTWWLAGSLAGFTALLVDFGQDGYLVVAVARDRSRGPDVLATTLLVRVALGVVLGFALEGVLRLLGYDATTRTVAALFYTGAVLSSLASGVMSVARGLERMGWPAFMRVANELLRTGFLVAAAALGARLRGLAAVEIVGAGMGLVVCGRALKRLPLRGGRFSFATARDLLRGGAPFLLWSGVLAIQPGIESVLLSKLGSREATGWFAASTKLIGVLALPATLLGSALAPTLARLHTTDETAFWRALREAVRVSLLFGAPVAVGILLFADPCVDLVYGGRGYGPAADNLRVLSAFTLPVFVNIVLGSALIAAGRQVVWAASKAATVLVTSLASFVVIPWFQARAGNGGVGAAWMWAASELAMLAIALLVLPRSALGRSVALDLLRVAAAAAAMAGAGRLLASAPLVVAFAGACLAYAAGLVAFGGVRRGDVALARDTVGGLLARRRPAVPAPEPARGGPRVEG